jgi:hypothetical protein
MILFIKLLLAHLIGDFILQPHSWVLQKEQKKLRAWQLYAHIAVHGVCSLLLLWNWAYWLLALSVALIHGLIDLIKLYFQKDTNRAVWFVADQALHLASLMVLVYCWGGVDTIKVQLLLGANSWIYITAVLFLVAAMPIIMRILLQKWADNIGLAGDDSLGNAGKYIGILERLLVFIFITVGHWEAVGFLITAKSVFRFSDLKVSKDRKLTEYILIGTLLSFGIAIITALITQFAIVLVV